MKSVPGSHLCNCIHILAHDFDSYYFLSSLEHSFLVHMWLEMNFEPYTPHFYVCLVPSVHPYECPVCALLAHRHPDEPNLFNRLRFLSFLTFFHILTCTLNIPQTGYLWSDLPPGQPYRPSRSSQPGSGRPTWQGEGRPGVGKALWVFCGVWAGPG